jgi:5-methyltetrahydropteroyltriglutamate--homocysteine methyltransferase
VRDCGSVSARTRPPFRADHVGSLLRPQSLLEARQEHAAGNLSDDELRAVEDQAIRAVVRMQDDMGLQSATDGEFRRASWHMDYIYRLGGIRPADEKLPVEFHNETQQRPAQAADRRSVQVCPARPVVPVSPMWILIHRRRQSAHL